MLNNKPNKTMKVKYPTTEAVVFFVFNFPDYHEVIHWIAQHQHVCGEDHLREKWERLADVYSSAEAWLRFYADCDTEIREAITDYITEVFAPNSMNFDPDELRAMNTASY